MTERVGDVDAPTVSFAPVAAPLRDVSGSRGAGLPVAVATALVMTTYSYLFAMWPSRNDSVPSAVALVRRWVNEPLGIGEDFGVLGISILLICGGYTVASATRRDGPARVAGCLALRAAVPALVATLGSATTVLLGGSPLTRPATVEVSASDLAANVLLVDRVLGRPSLLELSWVLTAGALFCLFFAATRALGERLPQAGDALGLVTALTIVLTAAGSGGWYHQLGLIVSFVPMACVGRSLADAGAGRAPAWSPVLAGTGTFVVLVAAERSYDELAGWWYPLTFVYAVLVVLLALAHGQRRAGNAPVRWLAGRGYQLLLFQGVIGYALVGVLCSTAGLALWPALIAAAAVSCLAAECGFRVLRWFEARLPRPAYRNTS